MIMEATDMIIKYWFWIIFVGFLVGVGFEIGSQIVWWLFDLVKEKIKFPLG